MITRTAFQGDHMWKLCFQLVMLPPSCKVTHIKWKSYRSNSKHHSAPQLFIVFTHFTQSMYSNSNGFHRTLHINCGNLFQQTSSHKPTVWYLPCMKWQRAKRNVKKVEHPKARVTQIFFTGAEKWVNIGLIIDRWCKSVGCYCCSDSA